MIIALSIVIAVETIAIFYLIRYAIALTKKLLFVSENIGVIKDAIDDFSNHLSEIYEMNMYYGDSTLEGLINHSKLFKETINNFKDVYTLSDALEEDVVEEGEEEESEEIVDSNSG